MLAGVAVAFLIVFLADLSYLFGATFHVKDRVRALKILVVDYDGGQLSNQFPSLDFNSSADYPDPSNLKQAVSQAKYWGAVFIQNRASSQLANAYQGGLAAEDGNSTEAVTYTYNAARYLTVASSYLVTNFQLLMRSSALRSLSTSDPKAIQAYLSPVTSTADIIRPTNQGSKSLYNTINTVMPVLGQFSYVLAMNGIFDESGIHDKMRVRDVWIMRFTAVV
ncbi:hypothetical protein BKA56DRAFT_622873 [Ilyonectria sp. MPI-CAGE-AT-0026]|nr:hypothetical protein BKA56DRAFT_622873 [Ilyonectria sp. MPI-CAGE-AT-0026]